MIFLHGVNHFLFWIVLNSSKYVYLCSFRFSYRRFTKFIISGCVQFVHNHYRTNRKVPYLHIWNGFLIDFWNERIYWIIYQPGVKEWRLVFLITSGILTFGTIVYSACAAGEELPWAAAGGESKQEEEEEEAAGDNTTDSLHANGSFANVD